MIEADRLISASAAREDDIIDRAIRPKKLAEMTLLTGLSAPRSWLITPVRIPSASRWRSLSKRPVSGVKRSITC